MVGQAASHRGVIICSSFGRRVVGENPRRETGERREMIGRGCMQTAVRGGHLTPFIHPSIPRKTGRERDRRLVPRV